jgi:hypothetical protein
MRGRDVYGKVGSDPSREVDVMELSGSTLLALTPVLLLVAGLVIYCLIDLIRAPPCDICRNRYGR